MGDRLQRMLENQKKREAAMAEKASKEQAAQAEARKEALARVPAPAISAAAAAADIVAPLENNRKLRKAIFAPLPSVQRGKPTLIGGDPHGENILYCLGNDIIIRSLTNPLEADLYVEHPRLTTVARYSPDKRWIASADERGVVRVWHANEVVQGVYFKLKSEKPALSGPVNDLAWSPDSTKIVAVGHGRDKFGEVFDMETGSSRGIITGHSKAVNSVDYRPKSPFRVITGGEDLALNWFEGPPFKWHHGMHEHQRFVNCVRFSPNGDLAMSVGSDKLAVLFDGQTGEKKSVLSTEHTGGIYCVSWSPDGTQVLTSSGDKTCKLWDVETGKAVTTFTFGSGVEDQQVGCLWQGNFLVSLNLRGHLSYLNPNNPNKPERVIQGHNKSIESLAYHKSSNSLYTGSYDAVLTRWNEIDGSMEAVGGDGHKNSIIGMAFQGDSLFSVAIDDTIRVTPHNHDFSGQATPIGGKPFGLAVSPTEPGVAVTGTFDQKVHIVRNGRVASSKAVNWTPQSFAFSADGRQVAVGADNNRIYTYELSGDNLNNEKTLEGHRGGVTALAFSPDGRFLASGDKNREILIWQDNKVHIKDWQYHSAKINKIAWSPDSKFLASASLDTNIIVWSLEAPSKRLIITAAHHGGVNDLTWLDQSTIASVGQDCTTRTWNVLWE
jgi:WD40 repeat protein